MRNHERIEAALPFSKRAPHQRMTNPVKERREKIRPEKVRLDKLLVDQGHAASRERAQALILAGRVLVDEQRIDKPGTSISTAAAIRLLGSDLKYVSRGGLKLEHALAHWSVSLTGLSCVDIGASTGGFTDCMLQAGAATVLAVDTGYGQIAQKLRDDPRVTLLERTNARLLAPGELRAQKNEDCHPSQSGEPALSLSKGPAFSFFAPAFLAMDVSFISATLVLPAVLNALSTPDKPWQGEAVVLIKPQFEAGRENIGKGGIVRDPDARQSAIQRVRDCVLEQHGTAVEVIDSPIHGMEGNHEYLLHARFA
jgi:23S rRNA (cytidine1920-2'-O)/16S rRNA (cytidine1409-2'-O)-methyltransferase